MTDLQKHLKEHQEFIDNAQQIVAKVNDMLTDIDKLLAGSGIGHQGSSGSESLACNAFEQELHALVKKYLGIETQGTQTGALSSAYPTDAVPEKAARARPGKYRQLV